MRTGRILMLVMLLPGLPLTNGCREDTARIPSQANTPGATDLSNDVAVSSDVEQFCGACHAVPRADTFPRDAWHDEVRRGYDFFYASGRGDLAPPPLADVVRYYRERAPLELEISRTKSATESVLAWRRSEITGTPSPDRLEIPAVSFLALTSRLPAGSRLLVSDMRGGSVLFTDADDGFRTLQRFAQLANPAAVRTCDLNADGFDELLVADLGSLLPEDHDRGGVIWLPDGFAQNGRDPVRLLGGIGRVADLSVGDFDGNGMQDIVVAEFGWHTTGSIRLMLNRGHGDDGIPRFETTIIDERSGTIHIPVCDLNGDGQLDFVAVISQEHEVIEAFLGNGDGTFQVQRIDDAGDPSFGSSGIQLVDLDQDGDLDVLSTNGDTFDSRYIKPYHGIRWLENRGVFPFHVHELTRMPGVHRALAADLDGDGDLDIAACALLPTGLRGDLPDGGLDSVIWLEQVSPGQFQRHAIEQHDLTHAAMLVEDLDGNGRNDIVVGRFSEQHNDARPMLTVYWNDGPSHETQPPEE